MGLEKESLPQSPPKGKFNILYLDIPWQYRDKRKDGKTRCGAENHYDTLSYEELLNLDVESIAADNSVIFLWSCWPLLKTHCPIKLMEAWDFSYVSLSFNWVKTYPNGKIFHGPGAYTKGSSEFCLMGKRGKVGRLIKDDEGNPIATDPREKLSVASNYVNSTIIAPHPRDDRGRIIHSAKPPEVRDRIVQLFGDVPRIELFARETVPGWDVLGNQCGGEAAGDIREILKKSNT